MKPSRIERVLLTVYWWPLPRWARPWFTLAVFALVGYLLVTAAN
ncbi:MAG: hypothetical protein ACYTHK_14120 [Planctomycetota bacterium]|jgi:hypothetical protein